MVTISAIEKRRTKLGQLHELGKVYECDVLCVGGGAAGCFAAIGAREQGREVLIVEKAAIERSGDSGAGQTDFPAHLRSGPEWDSDEAMNRYVYNYELLSDIPVIDIVYTKRVGEVIKRLEAMGVEFRKTPSGEYVRVQSMGQPGPYYLEFGHRDVKPHIAKATKRAGAKTIEKGMVTKLLKSNGRVIGAVGIDIRDGIFFIFKAKAAVLAAGDTCRLFSNHASGNPFWSHHGSWNTGSAPTLVFEVGAEVGDLELLRATIQPKGYPSPGMAVGMGHGGYLVNGRGERYMHKYHPVAERAPRPVLCYATYKEIAEGRGPCYLDYRHLPEHEFEELNILMPVMRNSYFDYLKGRGIDIRKDLIPVEVGVMYSYRGVIINEQCATNIPGLYAAGDCCSVVHALAGACTTGLVAGIEAGKYVGGVDFVEFDLEEISRLRDWTLAPLYRKEGIDYKELEGTVQRIMNEYCFFDTNEEKLRTAYEKLRKLDAFRDKPKAKDPHDLMRVHEALHLITAAQLLVRGAIERHESRGWLYRSDYPTRDDPAWEQHVVLKKRDTEIEVEFRPLRKNL